MSLDPHCCPSTGFTWTGTPTGQVGKLAQNAAYIAAGGGDGSGDKNAAAILLIHDLAGWSFVNLRLLADHYAAETGATVYLPDFFGGGSVPLDLVLQERFDEFDLMGFVKENSREKREGEIVACARALKERYAKVGAVGFVSLYCHLPFSFGPISKEKGAGWDLLSDGLFCCAGGFPGMMGRDQELTNTCF